MRQIALVAALLSGCRGETSPAPAACEPTPCSIAHVPPKPPSSGTLVTAAGTTPIDAACTATLRVDPFLAWEDGRSVDFVVSIACGGAAPVSFDGGWKGSFFLASETFDVVPLDTDGSVGTPAAVSMTRVSGDAVLGPAAVTPDFSESITITFGGADATQPRGTATFVLTASDFVIDSDAICGCS